MSKIKAMPLVEILSHPVYGTIPQGVPIEVDQETFDHFSQYGMMELVDKPKPALEKKPSAPKKGGKNKPKVNDEEEESAGEEEENPADEGEGENPEEDETTGETEAPAPRQRTTAQRQPRKKAN